MNWHQIIDERSYEMHQVIAGILRQSPEKLALVNDWIECRMSDPDYSIHSKDALQEWVDLILKTEMGKTPRFQDLEHQRISIAPR